MTNDLANIIAKRFIARADAKAKQYPDGEYRPVRKDPANVKSDTIPWSRDDVVAHLEGTQTFGHYFLDRDDTTKLFAFDIDLETTGLLPTLPTPVGEDISNESIAAWEASFAEGNPREAWRNRGHVARPYLKSQFRLIAEKLASRIHSDLEIPCAVAYSGHKGLHVYGFCGRSSAFDARKGAEWVLTEIGGFTLQDKRASTYKHDELWQHLAIEVYPKQITINGGGFGNLMRLPLGRNLKSKDPTFFVDLTAPLAELAPADPHWALSEGADNPWVSE